MCHNNNDLFARQREGKSQILDDSSNMVVADLRPLSSLPPLSRRIRVCSQFMNDLQTSEMSTSKKHRVLSQVLTLS